MHHKTIEREGSSLGQSYIKDQKLLISKQNAEEGHIWSSLRGVMYSCISQTQAKYFTNLSMGLTILYVIHQLLPLP